GVFTGCWHCWWFSLRLDRNPGFRDSTKARAAHHRLQPDAVVLNNRKAVPLPPGEDVQGFENDLPGENTAGFNTATVLDGPKETCLTMNGTWGYVPDDDAYKTVDELESTVRRAWAAGSNLLLNVGPRADGVIPLREQDLLRAVGARLRTEQVASSA
ncbi:alpha-L-fucosidase, partial [Streptomyces sp. NPDC056112]|uniref:alpha-L-fucosidase n=1 Tax=Streptomyces sp. NPDC056112 TaxID=3345715 RepID=UPI0035D6672D